MNQYSLRHFRTSNNPEKWLSALKTVFAVTILTDLPNKNHIIIRVQSSFTNNTIKIGMIDDCHVII